MMRSSTKPMMPMVNTATSSRASDSELPFWNSSHTNLPRPGFCASISEAMSTIQPTPSDNRRPVKISGNDEGMTSFTSLAVHDSRSTFATFNRSLSMDATPTAVLMMVGHNEHSVTVMAEIRKAFSKRGSAVTYTALTTMVTMGSQASGDTGLKI